jgi:hypothetical protein
MTISPVVAHLTFVSLLAFQLTFLMRFARRLGRLSAQITRVYPTGRYVPYWLFTTVTVLLKALFLGTRNTDVSTPVPLSFLFRSVPLNETFLLAFPTVVCTIRSKSTCGRLAQQFGSWCMATRRSQTCKTYALSADSSRPCNSPKPSHDLFTISCIYVLSLLLRDRIRMSCSMCVFFRSLWEVTVDE